MLIDDTRLDEQAYELEQRATFITGLQRNIGSLSAASRTDKKQIARLEENLALLNGLLSADAKQAQPSFDDAAHEDEDGTSPSRRGRAAAEALAQQQAAKIEGTTLTRMPCY